MGTKKENLRKKNFTFTEKHKFFKGRFWLNKYIFLFLIVYAIICIGSTYAYYAFSVQNDSVITGNVIAINFDLDVQLVVGSNEEMVPLLDAALPNALKGEGSSNGACVDSVGNLSCQVYKITLSNNGSRLQHLQGTVELYAKDGTGNRYTNLKWRELTNTTTINENKGINSMSKSILVSDLTMQSKESKTWYIAVWISEADYDQLETDKGDFGGVVTFESVDVTDEI